MNVYSPEYERQLLHLLPRSNTSKRAEICLLLGQRATQTAIPHLAVLLGGDPECLVRVAALRALSQIKGPVALREIAKVAADENSPVYAAANDVLRRLKSAESPL